MVAMAAGDWPAPASLLWLSRGRVGADAPNWRWFPSGATGGWLAAGGILDLCTASGVKLLVCISCCGWLVVGESLRVAISASVDREGEVRACRPRCPRGNYRIPLGQVGQRGARRHGNGSDNDCCCPLSPWLLCFVRSCKASRGDGARNEGQKPV